MNNYHHFYLSTENRDKILAEIGAVLEGVEIALNPIKVAVVDNGYIRPDRDELGNPVATQELTDWYWLDTEVALESEDARNLVKLLLASKYVDLVAEDDKQSASQQYSVAVIIDTSHRLAGYKSPSEQLGLAIKIASDIHLGQFDKGGKPYILHPLHLMQQLLFDLELATIAVLHDVIEDGHGTVTLESLKDAGFSPRVCDALQLLTHKPGQEYLGEYIQGICANYDAIRVKRKDLEHNSNITRLKGVSSEDLARAEKYHKAFVMLGEAKVKFMSE